MRSNKFLFCELDFSVHNEKKFELQSLYPAPKQIRDTEERSLLNDKGNLIGQVKRRCEMGRRLIFCVSAHRENTVTNYIGLSFVSKTAPNSIESELDKIVDLSVADSRLLIFVMDKGDADMNDVISKLPARLAEQKDFRILKLRVEDEDEQARRYTYNLTDLNDGLLWLLT